MTKEEQELLRQYKIEVQECVTIAQAKVLFARYRRKWEEARERSK